MNRDQQISVHELIHGEMFADFLEMADYLITERYKDPVTDEEAVAEDEAAYETTTHKMMEAPIELVPVVRVLIGKRSAE